MVVMFKPSFEVSFADFVHWPDIVRKRITRIGVLKKWRSGQKLLWEGEVASSALLVVKGRLRLSSFDHQGKEQIIGWLKPGEIGAMASLLGDVPFAFNFLADGPCEIMHFERKRLLALLEGDAPTSLAVARLLSVRLCRLTQKQLIGAFGTLEEKVWAAVQTLALKEPERNGRNIAISHTDLAHAVGASRYRVSLELKKFETEGRIRLGRGKICVL